MPKHNYNLLYLFNAVVLIFIATAFLDRVIQNGMFFDGVTYAAISRNLAIGKGSFWDVYYRGPWRFSEHPPLMFGIQALFFKILGDTYYTERIYCFVLWILTIGSLYKLWIASVKNNDTKKSFSFPLICWAIMPSVIWSYPNNILDTTMAFFDIWAVYFLYRAMPAKSLPYIYLVAGGILIFLATLTKGPIGFFPLALPFIYWLVYREQSFGQIVLKSLIPVATVCIIYLAFLNYQPANECLTEYLHEQLFKAIAGKREIVDSAFGRFQLIIDICIQLAPGVLLALLFFIIAKFLKLHTIKTTEGVKTGIFFLALALCGSIPIMISLKQRTFYLTPVFPYLAFALAHFTMPWFNALVLRVRLPLSKKTVNTAIAIAIAFCVVYISGKFGQTGRDEVLLSDIHQMQKYIPKGERIGVCHAMDNDFTFLAYIQRYHQLEVNLKYHKSKYILIDKNLCRGSFDKCLPKLGFVMMPYQFNNYILYRRLPTP